MGLIQIGSMHFEWGKKRKIPYPNTPDLYPTHLMNEGSAEKLEISSDNAYQLFITTAEVFAVIQRRGYLLASGAWKHYKTISDRVEEVKDSPFVNLLENPNPLMNGNDFLRQWSENLLVYGNNYAYELRGVSSQEVPFTINSLNPSQMRIKTTGKIWTATTIEEIIQYYEYLYGQSTEQKERFETKDILHTSLFSGSNPIKGDSPLIPLNMEIANIRAAKQFRNVILRKNGALGMLTPKVSGAGSIPLTSDERMRVEKEYQRKYGTKDNQSTILMAQSALDWVAMTYPTKDLMLFEEVDENFKRIIDAFGLNDNLFSKSKGSTYENLSQGLKHAYQTTVIPDAEEKAMSYSRRFNLLSKGEFLALDYSKIPALQENQKELAERLEKTANAVATLADRQLYNGDQLRAMVERINPQS